MAIACVGCMIKLPTKELQMNNESMRMTKKGKQLKTNKIITLVSNVLAINLSGAIKRTLIIPFIIFMPTFLFGWTINAGFESGTVGKQAIGSDAFNAPETGSATLIDSTSNGGYVHTGTKSARMDWLAGSSGYDRCTGYVAYPSAVKEGGEVWTRGYFYFPSNWQWSSYRIKGMRTRLTNGNISIGFVTDNINQVHLMYSNENTYTADRDFKNATITRGSWVCIETYVKLSTSPTEGKFRCWLNGVLVGTITEQTINSGNTATFGLVMSYWNSPGPLQNQSQWLDDFVYTTDTPSNVDADGNHMIGPTDWGKSSPVDKTPPSAPSNIKVNLK
jgi:hypothetical protein